MNIVQAPPKMKEFVYKRFYSISLVPILFCFLTCGYHRSSMAGFRWNMKKLFDAIRSTIRSSPYNGSISIHSKVYGSKVYIRPAKLSMGRKFFFWLYKHWHFRFRDGGRWEVCGSAYPLRQWVPTTKQRAQGSTRYMQTPTGAKKNCLGKRKENGSDIGRVISFKPCVRAISLPQPSTVGSLCEL